MFARRKYLQLEFKPGIFSKKFQIYPEVLKKHTKIFLRSGVDWNILMQEVITQFFKNCHFSSVQLKVIASENLESVLLDH